MRTVARCLREAGPLQRALSVSAKSAIASPLAKSYATASPRTTPATAVLRQQLQQHFQPVAARSLHTTPRLQKKEKQEHKPASFQDLDVLGNTPVPSTSVDICMYDGFTLNSGVTITDGDGALLVDGEAFSWRPWEIKGEMRVQNDKGQFDVPTEAFGVFDMLWPRPGKNANPFFKLPRREKPRITPEALIT